ncbi:hypothetical protein ACJMK2_038565, partial [Sinanodonta woodiana]
TRRHFDGVHGKRADMGTKGTSIYRVNKDTRRHFEGVYGKREDMGTKGTRINRASQ